MNRKTIAKLAAPLFAIACLALATPDANAQKIVIDPGHGGSDPGATSGSNYEKTFNIQTGLKIRNWLNADTADSGGGGSWNVLMTRTTDVFVSLGGRVNYANSNGANRFMSLHANGFSSSSANGIETFCHTSGGISIDLRNKVYQEAVAMWPLTQRGTKTANFYVLANTNMPAELHEAAFVTNAGDRVYLFNSTHQNNHARSEMYAVQRHYGLSKYTPGSGVTITVDNAGSGFTPGSGWWSSSATPGYWGSNYHVRGTAAVSDVSTWTFNIPSAGTYSVRAWWSAGANRSATAPYLIDRTGGTSVVHANQQVNGGKWNTLGSFHFNTGNRTVRLSCWTTSGFYVIADAIRLVK